MRSIRVVAPGALTTVQDLGRAGHASSGVSASGAADPLSLRVGNLLVGNDPGAAALEMTLVGGAFEVDTPALVAVTGSDFSPVVTDVSGRARPAAAWTALTVEPGETIRLGPTRSGARCYLCVRGGLDVPRVLGSRSTHVLTGLGGHRGRGLRMGDTLAIGSEAPGPAQVLRASPDVLERIIMRKLLRTVSGPQVDWFPRASVAAFHTTLWEVSEEADRLGLRMRGPVLTRNDERQLPTEGVCLGAIQVPDGGQPILLFVEAQTTGGYPKIANVVSADLPAVGQLRPRDRVRFEPVPPARARELLLEQTRLLAGALEPA